MAAMSEQFEVPSGLPEGPWQLETRPDGSFSIWAPIASGHYTWLLCARNQIEHRAKESLAVARAIAAIPAMIEEIGRLQKAWHDAECDRDRLRALNEEMRDILIVCLTRLEALCSCIEGSGCKDATLRTIVNAILAKSEATP
jgi:hypothetical protein